MDWLIFFCISVFVLAGSLFLGIYRSRKRQNGRRSASPFSIFYGGVLLSALLLLIPIYSASLQVADNRQLHVFVTSLHDTLQMFTLDADPSVVMDSYLCQNAALGRLYAIFLSVELILAPLLTFGFVISFFKNITAHLRFALRCFADLYVFSELNEKSLALAKSVRSNHPRAAIVFAGVSGRDEDQSSEFLQKAEDMRAICFRDDVLSVNFRLHWSGKETCFFAIGKDEASNISQAAEIFKIYKSVPRSHLYVFSSRIESELILNALEDEDAGEREKYIEVRRIDEVQSLIYQNLYAWVTGPDGAPRCAPSSIFTRSRQLNPPQGGEPVSISAVVLGTGQYGAEMIKALAWFCQMDGYRLTIHAFDMDPLAAERFAMLCPELMDEGHNGRDAEGDAFCDIHITGGVDVASDRFVRLITQIRDVSYVLVCLGSDEVNIRTAITLRTVFERMPGRRGENQPVIQAIVYNSEEVNALRTIKNHAGQSYDIEFIGDLDSSLSENTIINSRLQALAYRSHASWASGKAHNEKFWRYEYYYRSSCASAIHAAAKKACGVPEDRIGQLEHNRWNAYMRSEGYVYSGSPEKSTKNDLAKMHPRLVRYSDLKADEKTVNQEIGKA